MGWVSRMWRSFLALVLELRRDRLVRNGFLLLAAVDLGWMAWFAVARWLYEAGVDDTPYSWEFLHVTEEGGLPEWYNYVKLVALVILLARQTLVTRQAAYGALTVGFAVVLADDALALHEQAGAYLVERFDVEPSIGLRAQDIGEVLAWSAAGAVLVPLLLLGLHRSRREHADTVLGLLVPCLLLLFFAVVVDQLYKPGHDLFFGAGILLDVIEDGGEMLSISLALALTAAGTSGRIP